MRLGVNVPNFGPATTVEVMERWAHVAEGLGFDLLMMSDHVLITPDVSVRYPGPFQDPFTTLAWLAGRTNGRIQLGITVLIMPYRPPAVTAQLAASLHRLTGGKFVLGVAVGWARQEFEALGVPYGRRGRLTDEYLDEMHQIWGGGVEGVAAALTPEELPGPPVWIGGNSDAALRRAVVAGSAWHPLGFTMDWLTEAVDRLAAFADEAGRAVPTLAPRIKVRLTAEPVTDADRDAGIGTLEQVLDDLERLAALGSETVVLDPYHGDPAELEQPERSWRELATVVEAWRGRK
ncbi:LLM class flavin-dependent oxidoreductase [Catenulispora yoronensis]|uniref:LLM class flavin-dependent oxidoreductase n=1 Tax=Catenulispora yoronensis TaxID=450799 RepID=A0ABN2VD90_9ACTN